MKLLNLIKNDPWLKPYSNVIERRYQQVTDKEKDLLRGAKTLSDFATGYLYFGLHKSSDGWVVREWAPNATEIYLIGTFSEWKEKAMYRFKKLKNGIW